MNFSQYQNACGSSSTRRTSCALTAAVASVAVGSFVVYLFAAASSAPWLPATPEAVAQADACQRQASRPAREACMRQAIAQWQAADQRHLRLATAH